MRNFSITTALELKIGTQNNQTRLYLGLHFQRYSLTHVEDMRTKRLKRAFSPINQDSLFHTSKFLKISSKRVIMSSVGLGKGVGIPVKLMHESEGHVITVPLLHSFLSFSLCLSL